MSKAKELCIKILILSSRVFLKTCGIALMGLFFALFALIFYSFFTDVLGYHYDSGSGITLFIEALIVFALSGNMIFNYLSACFVSPGYSKDFVEELNSFQDEELDERCKICQLPKPGNVHHCSTCNKCVINLDHHCPWINNCVGFYNMRYFLLFIFYACLSCLSYIAFALPVLFSEKYSLVQLPLRFLTASLFAGAIGLTLIFFNLWAWYLAMTDQHFIDILKEREGNELRTTHKPIVWSRTYIQNRLELIFGTQSFKQVFYPSFRKLTESPFSLNYENQGLMADDDD